MNTHKNMKQLKSQLHNLVQKLSKLEAYGDSLTIYEIEEIKKQIHQHLENLEQAPIKRIRNSLEKKRRRRKRVKEQKKLNIKTKEKALRTSKKNIKMPSVESSPQNVIIKETPTTAIGQNPHQQLRSYHESKRFLRTFELLSLLNLTRSQDPEGTRKFSAQLNHLKSVWNVIRLENTPLCSTTENIENQWNTALFGVQEQSFYKPAQKLSDYINVRRKWDAFITQDANLGSSVPVGWVLPPENADRLWKRYLSLSPKDSNLN